MDPSRRSWRSKEAGSIPESFFFFLLWSMNDSFPTSNNLQKVDPLYIMWCERCHDYILAIYKMTLA